MTDMPALRQRDLVFDTCQVGVVLRAVVFVQMVVAVAALFGATTAWGWLSSVALITGAALPATLGWLLVMTLWLPVLDYARSYRPVVQRLGQYMDQPGCVEVLGLSRAQIAALHAHAGRELHAPSRPPRCPWLVVTPDTQPAVATALGADTWQPVATVRRPTDAADNLVLYRRAAR